MQLRSQLFRLSFSILIGLVSSLPPTSSAETAPLTVQSTETLPELNASFERTEGWTGADGAYSIRLDSSRTLWTFGDTWIGRITGGKRVDSKMINNSAAWQRLDVPNAPFKFFWRGSRKHPSSLLPADKNSTWFWPGDGAVLDGKLYMFLHRERRKPAQEPDFGFVEAGTVLMQVDNPLANPNAWRMSFKPLPDGKDTITFGNACLVKDDYLYTFCSFPPAQQGPNKHPLALARIHKSKAANMDMNGWQYLCHSGNPDSVAQQWRDKTVDPVILFPDAAPEMSVSQVFGIDGYIATYCPAGFGADIVIRHAITPEGPWSQPITIYHCPEDLSKIYVYSAKAHPELSRSTGELIVTYCRNTKFFADQLKQPNSYAPRCLLVRITDRSSD
jgi:hypothetical protein